MEVDQLNSQFNIKLKLHQIINHIQHSQPIIKLLDIRKLLKHTNLTAYQNIIIQAMSHTFQGHTSYWYIIQIHIGITLIIIDCPGELNAQVTSCVGVVVVQIRLSIIQDMLMLMIFHRGCMYLQVFLSVKIILTHVDGDLNKMVMEVEI